MSEVKLPDFSDIPSNSHRSKLEEKYGLQEEKKEKQKAIVDKEDVVVKKSSKNRFLQRFIQEDLVELKDYLWYDMIGPGILDTLEMIFFHEVSGRFSRDRSNYQSKSHYDYDRQYDRGRRNRRRSSRRDQNDRDYISEDYDYRNIVVKSRGKAEDLVQEMRDCIRDRGELSVAEFFELLGLPSRYTDNDWGWTRPGGIDIRRVPNGFLIKVPEADYLN